MSDQDTRKSMDDVLASIRRIVRAEKNPEAETVGEAEPETVDAGAESDGEIPLELTPDMRMAEANLEPQASAAEFVTTPPEVDEVAPPIPPIAPVADAVPALDPDAIRDMVRDVVREELASSGLTDTIKSVLKDELTTGDVGGNISRNVLRMIKSEVAKATAK